MLLDDFDFDAENNNDAMTDIDFKDTGNHAAEEAMAARYQRLQDTLSTLEEIPTMKQSARREASLRKLFRAFSQYATGPAGQMAVASRQDEIRTACNVRSGTTPAEQYAACRVLAVTSVVLGADQDEYYEAIERPLRRVVMANRATPVRVAALRALAMANLICSSDTETAESLLDLCEALAATEYRGLTVPGTLRAAALDCWSLLGTTISDYHLSGKDDVMIGRGLAILDLLKDSLEDQACPELRSAAGECLSLIHEARLNLGTDIGENTTERRYRQGSWEGSEFEVTMDEVKQRIAELSTESGYHMSKKAKKEQRATFREFMSTIVDDDAPEEIVSFRGGTITLHTWREIIQLNFIRHCLQGGFQIQLLTNETLQEIFGADGQLLNAMTNLTTLEKRLVMSKTSEASKAADQELTRQRKVRNNVKNYFLTADGDDL
eukprot:Sro1568_g283070.1 Interferon-related developmental regulator (437) ;mRNA; r:14054-15364